jgi:sugar phosphate isomerase/epimerase
MPEILLQVRLDSPKKVDEVFDLAERSGYDGIELDCSALSVDLDTLFIRSVDYNMPVRSIVAPTITFRRPLHFLLHGDIEAHSAIHTFKPRSIIFKVPNSPFLRDVSCFLFRDRLNYFKGLYGGSFICIENGAPSGSLRVPPVMDIKQVRDIAYDMDVFINFDVANCAASGYDILQAYDMLAPRVKGVHISDHKSPGSSHLVPGDGLLPLGALLSKMRANRYNGSFTIELDGQEVAGKDSGDLMVLYRELIGYVKSYF